MPRSIEDFAAERARPKRWSDNLSDEVKQAIIDSWHAGYGKHTIARWLVEEWGIADASPSKIETYIRAEGLTHNA